ncbi:MAG TPA: hypothetical protein VK171_06765 [Fimbriimonas sp.]|nr:hypothetical protein [Fimbriimonas sp.]
MIVDWREANLEAITQLWNSFHPERYRIDLELLKINTVDSPTFDWGASLIDVDVEDMVRGFVIIKKAPARFHRVLDPDAVHLGGLAFTEPMHGVDLMGEAKSILHQRGVTSILYGMDSRHFWPGVPVDAPKLNDFLMVEGFTFGGEYFDLERDLTDYKPPHPVEGDFRVVTEADIPSLKQFIEKEFPGRWTYDVLTKLEMEGCSDGFVGLFIGNECHGFASIQNGDCKYPIGGAVWRNDLGENWGALGPIGVSMKVRGKGMGGAMLSAGLLELQRRGTKRCIIDWTTLGEFYGKHGFEITRTYRAGKLVLD